MQFAQPGQLIVEGCRGRQVEQHRLDLGAEEVIRAAGAEGGEPGVLGAREKIDDDLRIREVTDLCVVGGDESAQGRGECCGSSGPGFRTQRGVTIHGGSEGSASPVGLDELLCGVDDPQRVRLGLVARVTPGGDAMAAEDAADRVRVGGLDRGDVLAELPAGATPGNPDHFLAERPRGERFAVRGRREGDAGVGMQVVDVRGIHQSVHGGVDRGGSTALAVEGIVERGDHLVFALDPGIDLAQRAQAVESQHGEARLGQGAEVTTRALHPEQFDGFAGDRVGLCALCGRVAARVVGDPRVGAEAVAARDQFCGGGVGHVHAPHPACWPPTRSAAIFAWYPDAA